MSNELGTQIDELNDLIEQALNKAMDIYRDHSVIPNIGDETTLENLVHGITVSDADGERQFHMIEWEESDNA